MASIDIRDIDRDVHIAARAEAEAENMSVNDVYERILASYCAQEFVPSGYPFTEVGEVDQLLIRVPAKLKGALRSLADEGGLTLRGLVMRIVAQHYRLPERSARKRVARVELDADLVREARRRHDEEGVSVRALSRELRIDRRTLGKAIRA